MLTSGICPRGQRPSLCQQPNLGKSPLAFLWKSSKRVMGSFSSLRFWGKATLFVQMWTFLTAYSPVWASTCPLGLLLSWEVLVFPLICRIHAKHTFQPDLESGLTEWRPDLQSQLKWSSTNYSPVIEASGLVGWWEHSTDTPTPPLIREYHQLLLAWLLTRGQALCWAPQQWLEHNREGGWGPYPQRALPVKKHYY